MVAALSALALSVQVGSSAPALPPQPGTPSPSCAPSPPTVGNWSQVYSKTGVSGVRATAPSYELTVDPWRPCRMYLAQDATSLQRTTDSARTFSPVFSDTASGTPPSGSFRASFLGVGEADHVTLGEAGNGDAVVQSADGAASWQLADNGVTGQPVSGLVFGAPGSGTTYATIVPPVDGSSNNSLGIGVPGGVAAPGLAVYVTRDDGQHWTAAKLPPPPPSLSRVGRPMMLQVDPGDPGHAWLFYSSPESTNPLFESRDYGANWSLLTHLPGRIDQFLVTRTPRHGVRLYTVGDFSLPRTPVTPVSSGVTTIQVSTDNAATWRVVPLPGLDVGVAMAADPADQERMSVVGTMTEDTGQHLFAAFVSIDGFTTEYPVIYPSALARTTPTISSPLHPGAAYPDTVLQADRLGNFYVTVQDQPVGTGPRQSVWAYNPRILPLVPTGAVTCPPAALGGCAGTAIQLGGCVLPPQLLATNGLPLQGRSVAGTGNGALGFDGIDLLLTQQGEYHDATTAVIHRLLPVSVGLCGVDADLLVHFSPSEIQRMGLAGSGGGPVLDEVTYDANHDEIWSAIGNAATGNGGGGNGSGTEVPVYHFPAAPPIGGGPVEATYAFTLSIGDACTGNHNADPLLAYDLGDDTLWSCTESGIPGHIRRDGSAIPTCVTGTVRQLEGRGGLLGNGLATWTLLRPGHLLTENEDDQTLVEVGTTGNCAQIRSYTHNQVTEAGGEDEQLACDPVTFGPGTLTNTAALWIRNPEFNLILAYALPGTSCPIPTHIRLTAPASVATQSSAALCGTLRTAAKSTPVAAEPLSFYLDSQLVGTGTSDRAGGACVDTLVPLPGGTYPVRVDFGGSAAHLNSSASGVLTVLAPGVAPPKPDLVPARIIPPPTHAAPAVPPSTTSVTQAQAQGQAQVQGQSQVQTQAGMATEKQEQPQVAFQGVSSDEVEGQPAPSSLLATRHRQAIPAPAIVGLQVALVLASAVALMVQYARSHALAYAATSRGNED